MKSSVTGRHVEVTSPIRRIIDQKLETLERLLNDEAVSVQCVLSQAGHLCHTEVVLHVRGDHMFHGESEAVQWSLGIGGAVDKINQQVHTLKGKRDRRHRHDSR